MIQNWTKTFITKDNREVLLRTPESDDVDALTTYANEISKEDTFLTLSGEIITRSEEEDMLKTIIDEIVVGNRFQIFGYSGNVLVVNAEIRRNTKSRKRSLHVCEMSIGILKPWRSVGLGSTIINELILKARLLGFRLLTLTVFANNSHAIHCYKKLGFKIGGEIPGVYLHKGNYIGQIHMFLPL